MKCRSAASPVTWLGAAILACAKLSLAACHDPKEACCNYWDGSQYSPLSRPPGTLPTVPDASRQNEPFEIEFVWDDLDGAVATQTWYSARRFSVRTRYGDEWTQPVPYCHPGDKRGTSPSTTILQDSPYYCEDMFYCIDTTLLAGPLEIHFGNFLDPTKGEGKDIWDNLWVRYQGLFLNVPKDCKTNKNIMGDWKQALCKVWEGPESEPEWRKLIGTDEPKARAEEN